MDTSVKFFLCAIRALSLSAQNTILGPRVTQIEGQGNGREFLNLSKATIDNIMSGAPWKVQDVEYANGCAPIQVKALLMLLMEITRLCRH